MEGCKSQHKSDVVIRTKLHTIGLFPGVSREAVKGCVNGGVKKGGRKGDKGGVSVVVVG